jgi:hypothetical protein
MHRRCFWRVNEMHRRSLHIIWRRLQAEVANFVVSRRDCQSQRQVEGAFDNKQLR